MEGDTSSYGNFISKRTLTHSERCRRILRNRLTTWIRSSMRISVKEFQDIDLGGTFSGVDLRRMAHEAGLERDYRLVLAPSSADFHGEWGHMARYALATCINPAHRLHRIPREDIRLGLSPSVMQLAIDFGGRVVDAYIAAITSDDGLPPSDPL